MRSDQDLSPREVLYLLINERWKIAPSDRVRDHWPEDVCAWPVHLAPILLLEKKPELLGEVWNAYRRNEVADRVSNYTDEFVEKVNDLEDLAEPLYSCFYCGVPTWESDAHMSVEEHRLCGSCVTRYTSCERCDDFSTDRYWLYDVQGSYYCETCREARAWYCDDCSEWYIEGNECQCERWCDCAPQPFSFRVPANGRGVITEDERIPVALAAGSITEQCVRDVAQKLWSESPAIQEAANTHGWGTIFNVIYNVEHTWTTKTGNYTKRLSRALYQSFKIKLEGDLLSRVGSTVRDQSAKVTEWQVEFTRDLNQGPAAFYNEDSCWWGGYGRSRCALKHWGGFALRSYPDDERDRDECEGRAWVQPLDENLQPTADTKDAFAYVVYNGYGDMEGFAGARIMAYLASRSYKKVGVHLEGQYVNGSNGYLIADEETLAKTERVEVTSLGHHQVVAA